jgi:hypothetical protein
MFELYVASDAVRRQIQDSLEPKGAPTTKIEQEPTRRVRARSRSAAALRTIADRLEPSPAAR